MSARHIDRFATRVTLNGATYALVVGEGTHRFFPAYGYCPGFIWVCTDAPDYVAPRHVADELDRLDAIQFEYEHIERGFDIREGVSK
jgi:hypothetical protein